MCLAHVHVVGDEEERKPAALNDVALIERTSGGLRVTDLFGNVTELEAEIRSIDFMSSLVRVEERARLPSEQ